MNENNDFNVFKRVAIAIITRTCYEGYLPSDEELEQILLRESKGCPMGHIQSRELLAICFASSKLTLSRTAIKSDEVVILTLEEKDSLMLQYGFAEGLLLTDLKLLGVESNKTSPCRATKLVADAILTGYLEAEGDLRAMAGLAELWDEPDGNYF
jgi:hypothetical protein